MFKNTLELKCREGHDISRTNFLNQLKGIHRCRVDNLKLLYT